MKTQAWGWAIVLIASALAAAAPAAAQEVRAGLVPTVQIVPLDTDFDLDVQVTEAGAPFNAFDLVVHYDPSALTLVPANPPSLQQGQYMLSACGNTFNLFDYHADTLTATVVLMCLDMALTGPGQIYHLRFHSANVEQVTTVEIRRMRFFNAGVRVNPVLTTNALVSIGSPLGVDGPGLLPGRIHLQAAPNPFRGRLDLTIEAPAEGGQRVDIEDVLGRRVRHIADGEFAAGTRHLVWDGRDDSGRTLPPGVYRVTLRAGTATMRRLVALVR
jgi:hypothetical protein